MGNQQSNKQHTEPYKQQKRETQQEQQSNKQHTEPYKQQKRETKPEHKVLVAYTIDGSERLTTKTEFERFKFLDIIKIETVTARHTYGWLFAEALKQIKTKEKTEGDWHVACIKEWPLLSNMCEWNVKKEDIISSLPFCICMEVYLDMLDTNYHSIINCPHLSEKDKITINNINSKSEINQFISQKCDAFDKIYNWHQFNQQNLNHLQSFNHWNDSGSREACEYGLKCYSFDRLEKGKTEIRDSCHIQMYRHPPRDFSRILKSKQQWNEYKFTSLHDDLQPLFKLPKLDDESKYNEVELLLEEVKANDKDGTWIDLVNLEHVESKLNHPRHKKLGKPLNDANMLAIILYCSIGTLNIDFCKSHRNNDFKTWKYLDYFLYQAICKLWLRERGTPQKLYSGVNGVTMDLQQFDASHQHSQWIRFNGQKITRKWFYMYPQTYVSASWNREVAMMYKAKNGILFEFNPMLRNVLICSDVSWISNYQDECEVLIARGIRRDYSTNVDQNTTQYMAASVIDQDISGSQYIECKNLKFLQTGCLWDQKNVLIMLVRWSSHDSLKGQLEDENNIFHVVSDDAENARNNGKYII